MPRNILTAEYRISQWGPKPTSTTTEYNSASAHPQYLCTPAQQDLSSNDLYPDHNDDHNSLARNNREHYYNEQAPLRAHDDTPCGAPSSPCRDPPAQSTDAELLNFNPTYVDQRYFLHHIRYC